MAIRATLWNEFRHEKSNEGVKKIYPNGLHRAIGAALEEAGGFETRYASLDEPEHGLTQEVLDNTDVLYWWGHMAHGEVKDEIVDRVQQRVLQGMGLIVLHSGHFSKIFRRMMGTNCSLQWREIAEKERVWNLAPNHPITEGIGKYFEIPNTEMYGERFDIPEPDRQIFISWYEGGEVMRSGCLWERGNGRVFYFAPGHESYPIYYNPDVRKVLVNAGRYCAARVCIDTAPAPHTEKPIENVPPKHVEFASVGVVQNAKNM